MSSIDIGGMRRITSARNNVNVNALAMTVLPVRTTVMVKAKPVSHKNPTSLPRFVMPVAIQATFPVHHHVPRRGLHATYGGIDKW